MNEQWRELLYPLGFLSAIAFGGRFLIQWILSEVHQKSLVNRTFWRLSLVGNILLMIHSLIQVQYHVCIVQSCNAVISWRNLNLMQETSLQISFKKVIFLFLLAISSCTSLFILQSLYADPPSAWFRLPVNAWIQPSHSVSPFWHLMGAAGMVLFSSRFWIQWWFAEKYRTSYLGRPFWWLSLIGDILSLSYFFHIADPVNLIGPVCGLIPYVRNLMLLRKEQPYSSSGSSPYG